MLPFLPMPAIDADQDAQAAVLLEAIGPAVVVLSPHSDDAPYSIAGVMQALARRGVRVEMLTLFSRSAYAPGRPGLDEADVTALRRAEDEAAGAAIDPQVRVLWLDHRDVALRHSLPVEAVVSRRPLDTDATELVHGLAGELAALCAAGETVLAPLGMGWHIDHRIAAAAGAALLRRGRCVHFYEDLPYAGFTRSSRLWLAQARRLWALRVPMRPLDVRTHALMDLKQTVFAIYDSQASPAFWSALRRQTARRGNAERLWLTRMRSARR